jgi:hypothetical protein
MSPSRLAAASCLLLGLMVAPAAAVPGATDRVPGATLLVPFFEVGTNQAERPHDTLLVVTNWLFANITIHYHVWDIDGEATGLQGNITLGNLETWDASMRDLISGASVAVRTQLTNGGFYHGFVTIDVVTAPTGLNPRQGGYPFGTTNALEGFIYYVRLLDGSSNGLSMVPLEHVPATTSSLMRGFYSSADNREEIDSTARFCAQQLSIDPGGTTACSNGTDDSDIDRFHLRIFRSSALDAGSRAVIFTWRPGLVGGPTTFCTSSGTCPTSYTYRQYNQDGVAVFSGTRTLPHVVNIINNSELVGTEAGWISLFDVPNVQIDTHVYAFSFNSAAPFGQPTLSWDAIFEGYIIP